MLHLATSLIKATSDYQSITVFYDLLYYSAYVFGSVFSIYYN